MKTIFLIDDDADDRDIFKTALDSLNFPYTYKEATDGHNALQMIDSEGFGIPDLIFLDLNMPRVNGHEFLIAVKKIPAYREVPVIIYSTSSLQEEKDSCFAQGATGFMTKHSSYDELCEALKQIVSEKLQ